MSSVASGDASGSIALPATLANQMKPSKANGGGKRNPAKTTTGSLSSAAKPSSDVIQMLAGSPFMATGASPVVRSSAVTRPSLNELLSMKPHGHQPPPERHQLQQQQQQQKRKLYNPVVGPEEL